MSFSSVWSGGFGASDGHHDASQLHEVESEQFPSTQVVVVVHAVAPQLDDTGDHVFICLHFILHDGEFTTISSCITTTPIWHPAWYITYYMLIIYLLM